MAAPGFLVEYVQQKRLVVGFCVKTDSKKNLIVRNQDNKQEKVGSSKVLFELQTPLSPEATHAEIQALVGAAVSERERLAEEFDLQDLWELLIEEGEEAWSLADMAGLVRDDAEEPAVLSGLYRALLADRTFFNRKQEEFLPKPREVVEETLTRIEVEAERAVEREVVGEWVRAIWQKRFQGKAPYPDEAPEAARRFLHQVRELALQGPDAPRAKDTLRLLKELNITRRDAAFTLMVRAGRWSEDENLLLHQNRTPMEFSPELEEAARESAATIDQVLSEPGRLDLTQEPTCTIDDAFTTEIDDALSFVHTERGWRIGIHIADASAFVLPGTELDREAAERATAIYLPEQKIRMIPEVLGDTVCSLKAGERRPAFSFLVDFDQDFQLLDSRFASSVIQVDERLTYQQADELLAGDCRWAPILAAARAHRDHRKSLGAITVPFPRSMVRVEGEEIIVEREDPNSISQLLVSEMMILANRLAAQYFVDHGIPAVFRSQQPPEGEIPPEEELDAPTLYVIRRQFRRGEMGPDPAPHAGLGLEQYTQVTSPIRRYVDLLMQRQLKSHLAEGSPRYDQDQLNDRTVFVKQATTLADQMERNRKAYWTLKLLESKRHQEMKAIVLANLPDKHWIQLVDVLWETDCPQIPNHPLPPGSEVFVQIETVFPRDRIVRVTPVADD